MKLTIAYANVIIAYGREVVPEKEMANHSSILAWRIPGRGEPGGAAVYGVAQSQTHLKGLSSSKVVL